MQIKKPDNYTDKHHKFITQLKGHNELKVKTIREQFGLSTAEASIFLMYATKTTN